MNVSKSMDREENRYYDKKIHRKLHQNDNRFVLRKYDGRIKKCRGCKIPFKSATVVPKFVIAHRELYVYGRIKTSKCLLMTERDFFYHCDSDCIRPRHPYFDMCDITVDPATACQLTESDTEHLRSLGIFL